MNRRVVTLATALLMAASITVAAAQDAPGQGPGQAPGQGGGRRGGGFGRGGQFGGRMGGLFLLRIPQVQTELKMTQPQIDKLDAKQQEIQDQMRAIFQGGGGFQQMSPEERQKAMQKMQDIQAKAVADILDTGQQKRFHQIELNLQGYRALEQKSNQDEIGLTADQRAKVAAIVTDENTARREAFQSLQGGDREAARSKMQEIQKSTEEKIGALLTDAQKSKWKEMLGAPFILQRTGAGPAA